MYPDAMQRNDLTSDYIQENEITPMCSSINVEALQTAEWRSENPEFVITGLKVLRTQTMVNLVRAFRKRTINLTPKKLKSI